MRHHKPHNKEMVRIWKDGQTKLVARTALGRYFNMGWAIVR